MEEKESIKLPSNLRNPRDNSLAMQGKNHQEVTLNRKERRELRMKNEL